MDPNNMTVFFINITSFYRHSPLEKNVSGYHGNALTAVWMQLNINVEIMPAYNPLNLDSIFSYCYQIPTNVFQL